jgi:hypothetical protein
MVENAGWGGGKAEKVRGTSFFLTWLNFDQNDMVLGQ